MENKLTITAETKLLRAQRRPGIRGDFAKWVLLRLLTGVIILWLVSILVFAATQALPSDLARTILGVEASEEQLEILREQLGLNQPAITQYFQWLAGALSGDLGTSLVSQAPVTDLLAPRLLNSLWLVFVSTLISVPFSILLGIFMASRKDSFVDRVLLRVGITINAIPDFVLATLLVVLLGTTIFKVLPPVAIIPDGEMPWSYPFELALPVITIVIMTSTYFYRLVRSSFIDVLSSEYIQMAELKGLKKYQILLKHALPNAVRPLIQAASISVAAILGGLVVLENVFAYNGVGTLLSDSIRNKDIPTVQASILLVAAAFFICNLVADVLSGAGNRRK